MKDSPLDHRRSLLQVVEGMEWTFTWLGERKWEYISRSASLRFVLSPRSHEVPNPFHGGEGFGRYTV